MNLTGISGMPGGMDAWNEKDTAWKKSTSYRPRESGYIYLVVGILPTGTGLASTFSTPLFSWVS